MNWWLVVSLSVSALMPDHEFYGYGYHQSIW